jgi:hypothetical protein
MLIQYDLAPSLAGRGNENETKGDSAIVVDTMLEGMLLL